MRRSTIKALGILGMTILTSVAHAETQGLTSLQGLSLKLIGGKVLSNCSVSTLKLCRNSSEVQVSDTLVAETRAHAETGKAISDSIALLRKRIESGKRLLANLPPDQLIHSRDYSEQLAQDEAALNSKMQEFNDKIGLYNEHVQYDFNRYRNFKNGSETNATLENLGAQATQHVVSGVVPGESAEPWEFFDVSYQPAMKMKLLVIFNAKFADPEMMLANCVQENAKLTFAGVKYSSETDLRCTMPNNRGFLLFEIVR